MSDKEIQLKRASAALISRDYETAARIYKLLIKEDYNDIDLKIQLGNLYVKSGDDKLALTCFEEIDKLQPGNVDILLALGGIYRRLENYEESIWALERAIDTGEKGIQISYSLGFTYRQMGKYNSAIECFQSVVDQNPRDVLAFNHLGAIYALQNDHEKAIATYQHGLKLDPNHPVLQLNLAKSLEAIGDEKKALAYYEGALRSKPGWTEAIDSYANLLLKDDKVKEADDVVSRALKVNPEDAKMHNAMGKVYNRKSVYDHAEKEFKKALSKNDKYSQALTGLAYSQEMQGKHSEAAETIQKAQQLSPDDVSILKQTAHILLSANYLPAAYEKISHLWKLNQEDVETVNLLGQYYICHGDEDKIEACFDKIEKLKPNYIDVYKDWGSRYLQKGDHKNAEDYLKVAVHENPNDSEPMVKLASLYETQNRNEEALTLLGKAGKVDSHNHSIKKMADKIQQKSSLDDAFAVEQQNADSFNNDFEKEAENPLGYSNQNLAEESPFDMGMGSGYSAENENAEADSPIDFDTEAQDDDSIDYDSSRDLGNLIDEKNDSVDSVIPKEHVDFLDDGLVDEDADEESDDEKGSDSVPVVESKAASERVPSRELPMDSDHAFDFNQFGAEDLSGDTDDLVSIDEIMSGDSDIDGKNSSDELIDFDEPVDEEDDNSFDSLKKELPAEDVSLDTDDYGFEEEDVKKPYNQHREFSNPNMFKSEDIGKPEVDEKPFVLPETSEPEHKYDARHQPKEISDDVYLSLERQIQRVANSADNAAYTANQAWRAAQFANDYAQNADDKVKDAEKRLNKSMDEKLDDMFNEKLAEALDSKIEEKIKEKIGDDLNSKISETIDNFVVTPDAELMEEEAEKETAEKEALEIATSYAIENPSEAEIMLKKAVEMLPSIVSAIGNKDVEEEFSTSLDMFKKLREMLEFLPPAKKKQFMTSRNRLMLDYIIAKLSGKPGLFATVSALLSSGIVSAPTPTDLITSDLSLDMSDDRDVIKLISSVMENVRQLCTNLEDDYLRDALDTEVLKLLEKLKNT